MICGSPVGGHLVTFQLTISSCLYPCASESSVWGIPDSVSDFTVLV